MNRSLWIGAVCLALGLAAGAYLSEIQPWEPWSPAAAQSSPLAATATAPQPLAPAPIPSDLTPDEQRNIRVYDAASRSVVNIDTTTIQTDPFWRMQRESEGSGSGAVLDKLGHIITNYHVVDGAQKIEVTLTSGADSFPAKLVGYDKEHDIAVLKIDAPADELIPISVGGSDNLRVGQWVFALGNPFGWDGTMTTGIISSLNRNLPSRVEGRQMQSLIQTDAAMNPGNSGGPLLNSNAEMIGMCVAIASRTGQNTGVGFAIPIDRIKSILPELIEHGHVVRADIGISAVMETNAGLVILRLIEDGPAEQAGLQGERLVTRQQGGIRYNVVDRSHADRILAIDGEAMRSGVRFRDKIWEYRPGDTVTLTVVRDGQRIDVPITLAGD